MDQKELQEKIALYYSKLTPGAQASFSSMTWLEILKQIAEKYALNQQQIETLSTETTLVLLGVLHPDEYENSLNNELKLPKEIIEKILLEINNSILEGTRTDLVEVFNQNTKTLEDEQNKKYEELDERFGKLPEEIQDAVSKTSYHDSLYKIFEENKLNIEQMGILEGIIMDMLLGTLHADKFKETMKAGLGLAEDKTQKIVNEVNETILKEIKNQVLRMNRNQNEKKEDTIQEDEIMKSAGIEINRNVTKKTTFIPPKKLLDSVQTPVKNTDHSLTNITPSANSGQAKPPQTPTSEKIILNASTEISAPEQKIEIPQAPVPTGSTGSTTLATGGSLQAKPPQAPSNSSRQETLKIETPQQKQEASPIAKVMTDIKKPSSNVVEPKPATYLKNKDPYRLSPDE